MVPNRYVGQIHPLGAYAKTRSPVVDGADLGSGSHPGRPPENMQRSDSWADWPSNSLNNANDFEKHLQELFDEVKTLISAGKKIDAIDLLKANYEAVKEQIGSGSKGMEEAAILDIIALGYMAAGEIEMVDTVLSLLNEIVDDLEDDESILESVLTHMGIMYSTLGKYKKSVLMYQRALKLLKSSYGEKSTSRVMPLLGLAKVHSTMGMTSKAIENYEEAIAILEFSRGVESADLVVPLSALGNLLLSAGKANEAEKPFSRILDIYAELYGEQDGRFGMAMCSLAHAKCAQVNADEAIQLYRKALEVIKESGYMTLDDNIMHKMRIDLAELLHVVGRGNEGRELLEECLVITEKYKGKEHPSSATDLVNLATSYSYSKNFVEAERLLRMSLRVMAKSTDPDDPSITFPMLQLAVTLCSLKRDKEAERLVLEVLRIREAAFGKESLPVGEALDCLVSIRTRLRDDNDEELLDLLKRVLAIQEKELGPASEEVMVTLKKMIYYMDKLGLKHEKFPLQRRLSELRNKYKDSIKY